MEQATAKAVASQEVEISADTPMTVTLPVGAWGGVLQMVRKGPMDQVESLVHAMQAQLTEQIKAAQAKAKAKSAASAAPAPAE